MEHVFADMKTTPYWWDAAPRPDEPPVELPDNVDVVIVGAGPAGLSAACRDYLLRLPGRREMDRAVRCEGDATHDAAISALLRRPDCGGR